MKTTKKAAVKKAAKPKKKLKTRKWDIVEGLKTEEDIAHYLAAVFKDGDPKWIVHAINNVARARGMTEIAKKAGITRAGLYKALYADTQPKFATVQKIIKAFDLHLTVTA